MKAPQSGNYTKDASGNITATVENEKEYAYVINEYNTGDAKNLTLKIKGVIDLSGAQCMIREAKGDITIAGENGAVIKNVTVNTFVQVSSSNESREDAKYATSALISKVAGHAVTIKNIVLENANVKNVEAGGVGFLVGQSEMLGNTSGKVTIESVTIRNSTIVGHRNTGALVGFSVNNIEIVGDNKLENVKVMTVGGRSALLIGLVEKNATVSCTGTINYDSSCKLSVYNNSASEQKYADGALTECPTGWDESLFKGNFVKIEGQDQYIYSVKTTKNDGTKDYSIYGFKADALMLKKGNVDTDPLKAYTTVESIKSAN